METAHKVKFAGFWNRFIALIFDVIIVSLIVFPFALVIGLISQNLVLVEVPFGLFTTTETVREMPETIKKYADGSTSVVLTSIVKENVLGLWENHYKMQTNSSKGNAEFSKELIDPNSGMKIKKTSSSDIEFYVIFIYWILLENSIWQASIGKKIMGIKVTTSDGGRPNFFQTVSRNLLKILSGLILFFGFMMAGWSTKKQALHDKIPNMLVIKGKS